MTPSNQTYLSPNYYRSGHKSYKTSTYQNYAELSEKLKFIAENQNEFRTAASVALSINRLCGTNVAADATIKAYNH